MDNFEGRKIAQLREQKKISQKTLGDIIGVTDRAVSKWEIGLSTPSAANLIRLSSFFSVPVEYFLKNENTPSRVCATNGMESLRELYKIGRGPSSSHTIGPEKACVIFKKDNPSADRFEAILYGSLAKTGRGHGTDSVIKKVMHPILCEVRFDVTKSNLPHPNTMVLTAFKNNKVISSVRVLSIGGGSIEMDNYPAEKPKSVYTFDKFEDISYYCNRNSKRLWQYVLENEDEDFSLYMHKVWKQMKKTINKGLEDDGILPGGLGVVKKAKSLYNSQHIDESAQTKENRLVCSYAFAVGEQNAGGETIVTAPTCGAAGVLPAVMYYEQIKGDYSDEKIVRALMTAGLVGNVIKTNASISGAECGCQAEVGSACAMAAAALGELFELSIDKIEYAAEIAIEHHLGLTCDPICGLVQIPCIERNAVAAMRAINAVSLASFLWGSRKISFDAVVKTMKETGRDMHSSYKETSEGGLAKVRL